MRLPATLARGVMRIARGSGFLKDWAPQERRIVQAEPTSFLGDLPPSAGPTMRQQRLFYEPEPALLLDAGEIVYTPAGIAWQGNRVDRRFSFQEVGPRHLWERPRDIVETFDRGFLLQSQTPKTYGDWVSEHLSSLAKAVDGKALHAPVFLPDWWLAKPYVRRDLATMGVEAVAVRQPVRILRPTVIQKTRPGHFWTQPEVRSLARAMGAEPQPARAGTAIYLSRAGERGEGGQRTLPNEVVEAALRRCDVLVVRTGETSPDRYRALAPWAETVFADHGSAMYNMIHWQTRRVVELFDPSYWDSSFLFFAAGLGISAYHVWQVDQGTTVDRLSRRSADLLAEPPSGRD